MAEEKHPFIELSEVINDYKINRDSFDANKLQDTREKIALLLFYLSDSVSTAISNFDRADWERKRNYAELIEENKWDKDGNKNTVAVTESLARIANEEKEKEVVEALRQKERVKIIMSASQQILHAISSRLHMIQK